MYFIFRSRNASEVFIQCGEFALTSLRIVDYISISPYYSSHNLQHNDIALLHLKKDFDLPDEENQNYINLAPICLPSFDSQDFFDSSDDCVAIAWNPDSEHGLPLYDFSIFRYSYDKWMLAECCFPM